MSLASKLASAVTSVALLAGAATVAAPASAQTVDPAAPAITWEDCPEQVNDASAECGRIDVPLEYSDPAGPTLSLGFVRHPAENQAAKRGTIFGNPGGPGGSGYAMWAGSGLEFPEALPAEWDRVAVQPRGLPGSGGMECNAMLNFLDPAYHVTPGQYIVDNCAEPVPGLKNSLTTANTAEDWEMVRRALGLESVSILGISYGTYLGSVYASRYPERVDKMVLDSAMDPSEDWSELLAQQMPLYEQTIHEFFGWAAARNDEFGLGTTPYQVYQTWSNAIYAEVGQRPSLAPPAATTADLAGTVPQSSFAPIDDAVKDAYNQASPFIAEAESAADATVNPSAALMNSLVYANTYGTINMPMYWADLANVINGSFFESEDFQAQMQELQNLSEDQMISMVSEQLSYSAMQTLMICNESTPGLNVQHIPDFLWNGYITRNSQLTAQLGFASGVTCNGMTPVSGKADYHSQLQTTPLQISATRDAQTPYSGHRTLADATGAHVITVNGPGHTHFGTGNQAVNDLVMNYLNTGEAQSTTVPGLN